MANQTFAALKKAARQEDRSFQSYRLVILGDCATQHLATALNGMAQLYGFSLNIFNADYNQSYLRIMDKRSELHTFVPDWCGVIFDDGVEGIEIGELGSGKAFSDFRLRLKELKKRGVFFAVCSMNNEDTAKEPFEKHPEMVLRLDDFAMFVANWEDKASNIVHIQQMLNIGMDSIVFLDDNPFDREQVRGMIHAITVPDLPGDPAEYI